MAHLPDSATAPASIGNHRAVLARYLSGELSAEMTLMYCLQAAPQLDRLLAELESAKLSALTAHEHTHAVALEYLVGLAQTNRAGCEDIARMLRSGVDTDRPAASVKEGIEFCRALFDWSVSQSPESSVALYTFGNPLILSAATTEIVGLMRQFGLLGPTRDILEIGCGIGRFAASLAPSVRSYAGIDVSANMIETAHQRCAGLANVSLMQCSGLDLAQFPSGSLDLVFAVDSFPYLVQSGMALVEKHLEESWRVLKPKGHLLILEFSYHRSLQSDQEDIARLADGHFDVLINGTRPLKLWDGAAFHLRARAHNRP